jgi:hypothetical protein
MKEFKTQIQRALDELGVRMIFAGSPEAKGRVERSFKTARDRLIKLMRVHGVTDIESGDAFLKTKHVPHRNRNRTVKPVSDADLHRPVGGFDLAAILSVQVARVVRNDFTVRRENVCHQILPSGSLPGLKRSRVIIERRIDGSIHIHFKETYLNYKIF